MSENAVELFFGSATQYYVAARFAARARLNPVAGNLFHHAVEMYLKGTLSKTKSLDQLKSLGHRLPRIWAAFKVEVSDPGLSTFDATISALHRFEELRYPDAVLAQGMASVIDFGKAPLPSSGQVGTEPQYYLSVQDMDELVSRLFTTASVNPRFFTSRLNDSGKQFLIEQNVASSLLT